MIPKSTNKTAMLLWTAILLAIFVIFPPPAFAKNDPNAQKPKVENKQLTPKEQTEQRIEEQIRQLDEKLNLTKKQKKAVRRTFKNEAKDLQSLRGDQALSPVQKAEKIQAIRRQTRENMNKILTADQQTKLAQAEEHALADVLQQHTNKRVEKLSKELNLTEEQKKALAPILENEAKDFQAVRDSNSLTDSQKAEKVKATLQLTRDQLNKILTPDQQAKFAQLKEQTRQESIQQRTSKRIQMFSEDLNLTEEQKKAVAPVFENEAKEIAVILSDKSLPREQRAAKTRAVRQATRDQLNKILTPEQRIKFEQAKDKATERPGPPGRIRPSAPPDSNS